MELAQTPKGKQDSELRNRIFYERLMFKSFANKKKMSMIITD